MSFPGGGVEAASMSSRWDFVLPDLLLPWWSVSGSGRESGEKCLGGGRRRAPASSRRLLHRKGLLGMKEVAPVFFLDMIDGRNRSYALRSDGVSPRPTNPKDDGAVACSGRLVRSTKEQVSDGISSGPGSWLVHLFVLRRWRRRHRRRRLRLDALWMCSKIWRAIFVFFIFLGVFVQFPVSAVIWTFPDVPTYAVISKF
jgi:hypothetical protein